MLKMVSLKISSFLLLILISFSFSFAQQPPAANPPAATKPAPAGARPIVTPVNVNGIPSAPTLNPPAATGFGTTGAQCIGVNCVYPTGTIPTGSPVNPVPQYPYGAQYPYAPNPYMMPPTPMMWSTPPMNAWTLLSQMCFAYADAIKKEPHTIRRTRDAIYRALDETGFTPDPEFPQEYARRAGRDLYEAMSEGARACQKFIDKDGNIGPWGTFAKELLEEHGEIFKNHVPSDITKYCPNFPNMTPERRKLFWIWVLAAMSAPESSCNPNEQTGDAIGLFQLDEQGCRVANVYVTSRELRNPYVNIRCAVARLAFEMRHRRTLMASHSRDRTGTYWAVLRGHSASSIDRKGAMRTMATLPKYSDCEAGSEGPPAMVSSTNLKKRVDLTQFQFEPQANAQGL